MEPILVSLLHSYNLASRCRHTCWSVQSNVAFADLLGEPIVGLADAVLETHLAEHASRHGRQLYYRIQLRKH